MSKALKRRGFFQFLGLGAVGASAAVIRKAQAEPPDPVLVPVCNACPRIVLDQETGHFKEHICEQCRTKNLPEVSGKVGVPSKHPVGSTGWARDQVVAGHRVRQRSWKDGVGCEMPAMVRDVFNQYYEKGISEFRGLPTTMDLLYGMDWEIVP